MNCAVDKLTRSVLYDGYTLYPYRGPSRVNRNRRASARLAPPGHGPNASALRAECLVAGGPFTALSGRAGFLHRLLRFVGEGPPSHEAVERRIEIDASLDELTEPMRNPFDFPSALEVDGAIHRFQYGVEGLVELSAVRLAPWLYRVIARIENLTPSDRDGLELRSLTSAHLVLQVHGGEFISLSDPPDELKPAAFSCRNENVWPVLVGEPGRRDTLLASSVLLPDYPQCATQFSGDLDDAAEVLSARETVCSR
jgi:hypothetical protein